jgi:pimeloyl-ACP methyl ester carboxylesterase
MIKSIPFKSSSVYYDDCGSGKTIVLLHGYLETMDIWTDFAKQLSKHFRVVSIDIPGHGRSGKVADIHTMELMADAVDTVLTSLRIENSFIIGHSMGGYVTLAYLAKYRHKLNGICLFHSTPFADTEEKKANRDREIEIILQGHQELLFKTNVPKSFATDNLEKFKDKVEWAKRIAAQCKPDGIIAILEGMKKRPDRQIILKETGLPVLFILGKKDNYIPFDLMHSVAERSANGEILVLENSGHMGFIEEPEICLNTIFSFANQF